MCPENIEIGEEDVSEYTRQLAATCNIKLRPTKKLCLTLKDKKRYTVHYSTLKCYISNGVVLERVHKVLSFCQSLWLHDFMKFTTDKRRNATNEFDKMLYKSVANNVFGKSIENVKQRINVKMVGSAAQLRRLVNKPSFQAIRLFGSNLAAVQLYKEKVKLNKPIAVGYSVLELAKKCMYEFFYSTLLEGFKDFNVRLIMSDTDSFLVHIEGDPESGATVESVLREHSDKFDFSGLEDGHPLKNDNGQIPLKMKLQHPNQVCLEAVVLSSKCYSIKTDCGSVSAMKGVSGIVQHERYKDCLLNETFYKGRVKSVKHCGQALSTERRMLSPIDTKRHYFSANRSLSFGHYRLQNGADH